YNIKNCLILNRTKKGKPTNEIIKSTFIKTVIISHAQRERERNSDHALLNREISGNALKILLIDSFSMRVLDSGI
uniref:hypothetical protein n=1 Tax=Chryseobacterium sp. TaxID=1871047 RepID=UPI0035B49556